MNVEKALKEVNENIDKIINSQNPILRKIFEESSLKSGKYLRAKLLLIFSEHFNENVLNAATAVELLHFASLIHDDILDQSSIRRSIPTLHTKWGIPISLLFGDFLFSESFSLAASIKNKQFIKEMIDASSKTLTGEIIQQYMKNDTTISEEKYLSIIQKKTGTLFASACKIGLMLRSPNNKSIQKAYNFGLNIGLAYQIFDDCNDYIDIGNRLNKYSDIKQGIITLPLIYLFKKCSYDEKEDVINIINNRLNFEKISELMDKYKIIVDCFSYAGKFLKETYKEILYFENNTNYYEIIAFIEDKIFNAQNKYNTIKLSL